MKRLSNTQKRVAFLSDHGAGVRGGAKGILIIVALALSLIPFRTNLSQEGHTSDPYLERRKHLIESVLKPGGIRNEAVLHAIFATPRHEFVPPALRDQAYLDRALPIGEAQTISSPFIVALMTEVLHPKHTDKVLEVGTGSGYQAAVLSPLVKEVYTIEIVEELGVTTTRLLERLGYKNIFTKVGDGFEGWDEHAPFDKIIVTCSPDKPPEPLVNQLIEGGLMVIPVGTRYQQLLRVFKKQDDQLVPIYARPTLFVPMTGTAETQRHDTIDPANPSIVNGDFEATASDHYIPNWYYEFGAKLTSDLHAPSGKQVVSFTNEKHGGPSSLLQGLPLDGRLVKKLRLSGFVKTSGVKLGQTWEEQPFVVLQFLDDHRNQIGYNWLGPFVGDLDWHKAENVLSVPPESREAIVMIGLFGAVGLASFDDIAIDVIERTPVEK